MCFTTCVVTTMKFTAPPLDCARSGYLHTICSQSSQKRRFHHYDSDCCLNNTWPSFHTDRIDRCCRLTNNTCSSCARKPHQFHQRLQVSRLQIAPVPSASAGLSLLQITPVSSGFHAVVRILDILHGVRARFHLTSPRSTLGGLLLLTAVI